MKLTIYTDGGSRNNPGHAAIGFVLSSDENVILYKEGRYIGIETNNVAEYTAVLEALKKAKELDGKHHFDMITCYLDSNLIVQQMNGKFKIKALHLLPIIEHIRALLRDLPYTTFNHVLRAKNKAADSLVNEALDIHLGIQSRR